MIELKLFDVTIRRVYTPAYLEKWPRRNSHEDHSHPEFAESAQAVADKWDEIHARPYPYWDEKYKDHVAAVVEADPEPRRARFRELAAKLGWDYCCDLAIQAGCVCRYKTVCPEHGAKCHGSHD